MVRLWYSSSEFFEQDQDVQQIKPLHSMYDAHKCLIKNLNVLKANPCFNMFKIMSLGGRVPQDQFYGVILIFLKSWNTLWKVVHASHRTQKLLLNFRRHRVLELQIKTWQTIDFGIHLTFISKPFHPLEPYWNGLSSLEQF